MQVSILRPLGYEPSTLTTAPIRWRGVHTYRSINAKKFLRADGNSTTSPRVRTRFIVWGGSLCSQTPLAFRSQDLDASPHWSAAIRA